MKKRFSFVEEETEFCILVPVSNRSPPCTPQQKLSRLTFFFKIKFKIKQKKKETENSYKFITYSMLMENFFSNTHIHSVSHTYINQQILFYFVYNI